MPFQFGANAAGPVANPRRFGPQLRIIDHFFDVAQAVGPVEKIVAGNRRDDPFGCILDWPVAWSGRSAQASPTIRIAS
jgi:hypothetical protein